MLYTFWNEFKDAYMLYSQTTICLILLFIAVIYLIVMHPGENKNLVWFVCTGFLLLLFPYLGHWLMNWKMEYGNQWIICSIFCAAVVIAYAGTRFLESAKNTWEKWIIGLVYVIIIQVCLNLPYIGNTNG